MAIKNTNNLKFEILKEIPRQSKISRTYDDEEERWINFPLGTEITGIGKVNRIIKFVVKEIRRIKEILKAEEIDFILEGNIGGHHFEYDTVIGKDINKTNEFVDAAFTEIKKLSRILNTDKIIFHKIILTFH